VQPQFVGDFAQQNQRTPLADFAVIEEMLLALDDPPAPRARWSSKRWCTFSTATWLPGNACGCRLAVQCRACCGRVRATGFSAYKPVDAQLRTAAWLTLNPPLPLDLAPQITSGVM